MDQIGERSMFRPRIDTMMVHLGHPLMSKAINSLTRRRFPGPQAVSRWTARYGEVPDGADAMILLHVEELAVNELRETFHHWIQTLRFCVKDGELGSEVSHLPAFQLRATSVCQDASGVERAKNLLNDVEPDLLEVVKNAQRSLTKRLTVQLQADGELAKTEEQTKYQSRQGEVSSLIVENSLAKLESQIARLKQDLQQGRLFDKQAQLDDLDRSLEIKKEELERRRMHYEEVREQLARERDRIMNLLLPKRFALQGTAQVFPVAVEVWLPRNTGAAS